MLKCERHGEMPNARGVCPICDTESGRSHHNRRGLEIKRRKNMPSPSGSKRKQWNFDSGKESKK